VAIDRQEYLKLNKGWICRPYKLSIIGNMVMALFWKSKKKTVDPGTPRDIT
jgi:hypothetical protein